MKTFTEALADAHRQFAAPVARQRRALNGATMGTRYLAIFYAEEALDLAPVAVALSAAVERVDQQMSTWKPDSDLNRLNAGAVGDWVALPQQLLTVLAAALHVERISDGAFDVGVGSIVRACGFGPPLLDAALVEGTSLPRPATAGALELDPARGRARKMAPLALDLSGIAKGFAVDEMAATMAAHGISDWLVGIDGEMRASGAKPGGEPWVVAHERPDRTLREAMGVIELADVAVATSGNYRHWREVDGQIISHTIDPGTNAPAINAIASVTVLASTCMMADALATALLVQGLPTGMQLARRLGVEAIFVTEGGDIVSTLT